MILLAVVTLCCGTVLLIGHRAADVLSAKWTADRTDRQQTSSERFRLEQRRVAVAEREVAIKEQQHQRPDASQPMPPELEDRIRSWEDDWAQEQERSNIMALFGVYRDWDQVRSKLPALAPILTSDIAAPRDGMVQGMVQ